MKYPLSLLACAVTCHLATPTQAAENLERIEVTSSFRHGDINQLPASVSIFTDQQIEQRQAQYIDDLIGAAANTNFTSGAARGKFIQIRGIGERSQFSEPLNPSVGLVIDDFDFSGVAGIGTLFDVEQVEVLRGPQATEFGASAMAGVIRLKTTEATADQISRFTASVGQQNTWSIGAAYGNRITDNLNYRVALHQYKSDGFIENIFLNRDDTDNLDELTGRMKLRYQPNDKVTFDINYQYFDIDNGYDAFSLDNDGRTRADEPGVDKQETHALGVKATIDTEFANWQLALSRSTSELTYGYDEDWTFVGFHPLEYSSTDYYFRDVETNVLDARVLSNQTSRIFNDSTSWVAGVYYKQSSQSQRREYTFASSQFSSEYDPDNFALYVQTDSQLTAQLLLSVGLRVDNYQIDYIDNSNFTEQSDKTMLGGKISLDYSIDTATVYASVSRGYKTAGFNPDERVANDKRVYDPEFNWNYELGVKGRLTDLDAFVRMAVFYMDRQDTQISDFDVQQRDDGSATFIDVIGNADTGTNWGVELEAGWQVSDSLSIEASYGFLDATFEGYTLTDGTVIDKQEQAQAPRYTFNLAASYALTDQWGIQVNVEGKDEHRFSDGHDERSPAYELVNARLNYSLGDWQWSLFAKNLLDETYFIRGFGGFSNDPRDEYAFNEPYFQLGDGRQVGLAVNYTF